MNITRQLTLGFYHLLCSTLLNAGYKEDVRYTELVSVLTDRGVSVPSGLNVGVTQVEASTSETDPDIYFPDSAISEFNGKTITDQTASGKKSNHATSVGKNLYGLNSSMAPGINNIDVYYAGDWLTNRGWRSGTPSTEANPLQNHSWISGDTSNNATLRMDYAVNRDSFLPVFGLNNGSSSTVPTIYGSAYNGITVGLSNGDHSRGGTVSDGSGRIKPEIVAPGSNFTSFVTPFVTATAAMLIEAAGSDATAKDPLTLKAILLAAADKSPFANWDQTTAEPIDGVYGAGQLDVYEAYFIQDAGQQGANSTINERGWNLDSLSSNSSHDYNISVPSGFGLRNLSALITWNRQVTRAQEGPGRFATISYTPSLANMSLELKVTGDASIYKSDSSDDNLEHIWRDSSNSLAPGNYTLSVATDTEAEYAIAWRSELYQDYNLWKAAAFTTTPIADQESTDDPDFDGVINLLEQAFGGDPESADSENLPTLQLTEDAGETYLEIRFRRPTYDNGLTYTPLTTTSLTGTWSNASSDIQLQNIAPDSGDFEWHIYRRSNPVSLNDQAFLKINVTETL